MNKIQRQVRLVEQDYNKLKEIAAEYRTTISSLIRQAIAEFIKRNK